MFDHSETGFYDDFVPLKNNTDKKEPAVAYTEKANRIDLQTARGYRSYSGVLSKDAVLIEADDQQNSELLFKVVQGEKLCCIISNREGGQGLHSLFFNNGEIATATKIMLACGIQVDIKVGSRNGLECLKWQGVERVPVYDSKPYQEVPKYFTPLKGSNIDFASLEAGDGRNDALFRYILTLQRFNFTVDEIRQCIRIINTYVVKESISDKELDVILRDGAFKKKAFFNGRTFLHDQFAEHIRRTYNIKRINGQLHIYKDGVYISGDNEIKKAMLKEISSLTDAKRTEALKQLDLICDEFSIDERMADLIAFRNGVLNLKSKDEQLLPFSPDNIITNRIPWDYNPNAYSEIADKTLDKIACHDKNIRSLLEECIGSCFYRSNTLGGGKAFILTGEGANGKSTFIEVLQAILGEDNYSVLDLKNLDAKFSTVMLVGKLANLGDDISDEFNSDISVFKKIVTGNKITAQQKGQPEFDFKPFCKLIFSANDVPRMKDRTGAAQRRLLLIPFNAHFTKSDSDYDNTIAFKLKEQESIEYFIRIGIQGLQRVLLNRDYTASAKVTAQLEEYRISNNPLLSFLQYCNDEGIPIENEPASTVFENYQGYCAKNGYQALASNEFSKQLQRNTGLISKRQTVNKRKYSVYVKNTGQG
ncbi:MAG TPA: DNA primase [Clostridiales bacterium]|nr:DNA primase [Clostridiales bacterium]